MQTTGGGKTGAISRPVGGAGRARELVRTLQLWDGEHLGSVENFAQS